MSNPGVTYEILPRWTIASKVISFTLITAISPFIAVKEATRPGEGAILSVGVALFVLMAVLSAIEVRRSLPLVHTVVVNDAEIIFRQWRGELVVRAGEATSLHRYRLQRTTFEIRAVGGRASIHGHLPWLDVPGFNEVVAALKEQNPDMTNKAC